MRTLALLAATLSLFSVPLDLSGRIVDAGGKPLRGARVFIYTASARVGVNPFCPSCYADCSKSAVTDDNGNFVITALDANLIFRVLVVSDGFQPTFVEKVDPLKGPIQTKLRPYDPGSLAPKHFIRGRVLTPEGSLVTGAEVKPRVFKTAAYSGFMQGIVDPVAVTNLRGEFTLTSKSPVEHISVKVEARGFAPHLFDELSPRDVIHELRLERGVSVTGQIVRDSKPLSGVLVGLVQVDRRSETFLGHTEIATDQTGHFLFSNIAPNDQYYIYGVMNSFKVSDSLPVVKVKVGRDGTTTNAGVLTTVSGHRLTGRVILSDGKPIPLHTRVHVSRQQAWDSQIIELDKEGRFVAERLPTEEYSVSSFIKGYELSAKNACADPLNTYRLVGQVDRDVSDLTILYEPITRKEIRPSDSANGPAFRGPIKGLGERQQQVIRGVDPISVR